MSAKKRTSKALAILIPTGVLGISSALAAMQAHAETPVGLATNATLVADRLSEIRSAVSLVNSTATESVSGAKLMLADWLNVGGGLGWRNGGWGNGGWHNAANWGNGGWGNGGWHNWHNFWHNW
jgi:rSAM-associated Gly-rich repeat protein